MRDIEPYKLDMVGLTSTHSTGSGISFSGIAQGERHRVGVGRLWLLYVLMH